MAVKPTKPTKEEELTTMLETLKESFENDLNTETWEYINEYIDPEEDNEEEEDGTEINDIEEELDTIALSLQSRLDEITRIKQFISENFKD
jgi:hypothetical protein